MPTVTLSSNLWNGPTNCNAELSVESFRTIVEDELRIIYPDIEVSITNNLDWRVIQGSREDKEIIEAVIQAVFVDVDWEV